MTDAVYYGTKADTYIRHMRRYAGTLDIDYLESIREEAFLVNFPRSKTRRFCSDRTTPLGTLPLDQVLWQTALTFVRASTHRR